ncbi:Hypothetical protein NCS54_01157700 [Fusarium falciforme]|uniref:Hypothetical protein n=1 Tax=Fusarium falciforme TaxID=195108 RepID=UPI002300544C|nr:Hypothetical protein NCS54_01157700 [Fusarium falciforme]WAO94015.1 Hypothetical protein NCS54_01157700 [Fusarium falciforme]
MSRRRSPSPHQSESTMSSPVGSGCSPDYFGEDIFPLIDPYEDPVGQWTQSGLLVQDADPFGFTNQEGLRETSSGSMPQMAMDLPVLDGGFLPGTTTPGERNIFARTTNLFTVLGPDVHTRVLGKRRCGSTSTPTSRRSLASVLFVL